MREDALREMWAATTEKVNKQSDLILNLENQLALERKKYQATSDQLELTEKVAKKGKRKSLLTGIGIGLIGGFVGAVVLTN